MDNGLECDKIDNQLCAKILVAKFLKVYLKLNFLPGSLMRLWETYGHPLSGISDQKSPCENAEAFANKNYKSPERR